MYASCRSSQRCQNGGTCDSLKTDYICWCNDDYEGTRCESMTQMQLYTLTKHARAHTRSLTHTRKHEHTHKHTHTHTHTHTHSHALAPKHGFILHIARTLSVVYMQWTIQQSTHEVRRILISVIKYKDSLIKRKIERLVLCTILINMII